MAKRKSDIPFGRDPASRLMPWIVAVMVCITGLAIAGAFVLAAFSSRWEAGLAGALTVQIPPPVDAALEGADRTALVEEVVAAIRKTPGVARATPLPDAEMRRLLAPWLGATVDPRDLPLPTLIAVDLIDGITAARVDLSDLGRRLEALAPGAMIDDHGQWQTRLISFLGTLRMVAVALVAIVTLAGIIVVILTTRGSLLAHRQTIELLHLFGARDAYIAKQFARQAMFAGFKGGLLGIVVTAATILALGQGAASTGVVLTDGAVLVPLHWAVLAALPVVAGAIARLAARWTVLHALARMI